MPGLLIKRDPLPIVRSGMLLPVGSHLFSFVDEDDYKRLCRYRWRLRMSNACFYAVRRVHKDGKTYEIKLHREIMHTPEGYECHHKNRDTLDNRKINLKNLTPAEHAERHGLQIYT